MPVCRSFLLLGFVLTALAGCAERGSIRPVPPDAPKAATVEVFAATNRKALTVGPETGRSENIRHFRLLARVPPDRKAGQLSLPKGRVNPKRDFLAEEFGEYRSGKAFVEAINRRLGALPASDRNVTLYVHGFNKTFAEGVMRLAQLDHDLGASGVPVHFSWPSAGLPVGYAHDRDSVLYSRDALEEVMRSMPTGRQRLLLVAHSMGAQLVMETLRQIEIATPGWGRRNLQGVILISPDIDVDLFRAQVTVIQCLHLGFHAAQIEEQLLLSGRRAHFHQRP